METVRECREMNGEHYGFRRICVYCASNPGKNPNFVAAARSLGGQFAARGIEAVYGGGRLGLMGAMADATLADGGRVIGVMPQALVDMEIAHRGLTELHIVGSMHERKMLMTSLADAFVILPGGWGTLDELCEALTWAQLHIHTKPCILWNVEGYYDQFLSFLQRALTDGLLKPDDHRRLLVAKQVEDIFETLRTVEMKADTVAVEVR